MLRIVTCLLLLAAFGTPSWAQTSMTPAHPKFVRVNAAPIINRMRGASPNVAASTAVDNGIQYHGGQILDDANGVNAYFIRYGDWSKDTAAQKVLVNFITHIGGSSYFNVNTTYYSLAPGPNGKPAVKDRVINAVHYMGSTTDSYSYGSTIDDNALANIVGNAVTDGRLPLDINGVYFVLTSADVMEASGFCTAYCAFHGYASSPDGTINLPTAFVGNAELQCPNFCIWDDQTPLSGNLGADGMANMMAHELEESVTDPFGDAWWVTGTGNENGDQCLFTFPGPFHSGSASDPQPPDMKFGGIPYLIQENWVNAKGGYCAIRWDE
jgi:hypothetical protein